MAKRRMLILVKVAPVPEPDDDADDSGEKKSEVKTGFHVLAAAGGGSATSESGGSTPQPGSAGSKTGSGSGAGGMLPLGTCRQIIKAVGGFNVYPDGSGPEGWGSTPGMATLYGPGCVIELPMAGGDDARSEPEISQAMVTISDEEFAWPVLSRICKANAWKMMDPESGRMFG